MRISTRLKEGFTEICSMAFYDKYEKDEYYFTPEGYIVFTEKHHLKRGYCCQNNCRHCPWRKRVQEKKPPTTPGAH
jgi:hypothetical protein